MQVKGFTLIELIATVSILSILSFVGIPSLFSVVENADLKTGTQNLLRGVQLARATAVKENRPITLCGSDDGRTCSRDWRDTLLIFNDINDDHQASENEIIVQQDLGLKHGQVRTRLGFGLRYMVFNANGSARYLGSLIVCPDRTNDSAIRRVTWNRVGRPYYGRDRDGSGVIENTAGKDMTCN